MIIPVILSGGSGTRLWPLSTPETPKQFLPLVSEKTLFQETLTRLGGVSGLADPIVVCNQAHGALVAGQLEAIGMTARAIVLEPEGRNTAPAIAVAGMVSLGSEPFGAEPPGSAPKGSDPTLLILPADHVIADTAAFHAAITHAVEAAAEGRLVTFGIVPTRPETGYGYIEQGEDGAAGWREVRRFVEKPDAETAANYLASGNFLWNSGMFVFRARTLLDELGRLAPAIRSVAEAAVQGSVQDTGFTRLGLAFLESPSDSIDYAVMEKTDRAAVVPLDAGWSDVGSWDALYDVLGKDEAGNVFRGDVVSLDTRGNFVHADSRKIALLGLEDIVVIEAGDRLLIMSKSRSQDVKELQKKLDEDTG